MLIPDSTFDTIADRDFFETFKHYPVVTSDHIDRVRVLLPKEWHVIREGIWVHCGPPHTLIPVTGWKIHLSATLANAPALLATAARVLVDAGVSFKFIADRLLLHLVNGKTWPRGGAGKFITVYPRSEAECRLLLETLATATLAFKGPYILSDRRYKDSCVVYYRYGGFKPLRHLKVSGDQDAAMQASDGTVVRDERTPFFQLPDGVVDPFRPTPEDAEPTGDTALKNGRYKIEGALAFSNSGGVYVAIDQATGNKVVVKEARPYTNQSMRGTDAAWQLQKEYRLLTLLADTGISARPVDFFREWEHFYLVEEYLDGRVLRGYNAQHSLPLRTRPTQQDADDFVREFCAAYANIARVLDTVHERGVVFSDVSHYNVMMLLAGDAPRLIDFEGAYESAVDEPTLIYTPGFASAELLAKGASTIEDDCFGLGGLMLAALMPVNRLMTLNERAHEPFLDSFVRDLGFPRRIADTIAALLRPERATRPTLKHVIDVLEAPHVIGCPAVGSAESDQEDIAALCDQTIRFIETAASPGRQDRLFPAGPEVFSTNPLNIAFGAAGVAHAMQRTRGNVPERVIDWMLAQPLSPETYPPGLYVGLSGIAWVLSDLGRQDAAAHVLAMADAHPLLTECPDIFYGLAGWGMTHLRFFLESGDEHHLAKARIAGDRLLASGQRAEGRRWYSSLGHDCSGFAHGAAGISTFFLYLFLVTRDTQYEEAGRACLEYVRDKVLITKDEGWSWRAREGEPTYTPYWRWGSAGVGVAVLRYYVALGDETYRPWLDRIVLDADRKYTIFPGRFFGLAGIGDFFLDLAEFGYEPEASMASARKLLSGALLFRLQRPTGLAFPGETLARISCDYGTGGAGIATFMHRLVHGGSASFMLDALIAGRHQRATTETRDAILRGDAVVTSAASPLNVPACAGSLTGHVE